MNPRTIYEREFIFTGIESTSDASNIAQDMQAQGDLADKTGLPNRILHEADPGHYYVLVWNWSAESAFQLMTAIAVTSSIDQPKDSVTRTFESSEYAVFPMEGTAPNLVEPWKEIAEWFPFELSGFTTSFRRYNLVAGTGEILVPTKPNLAPVT